MKQFERLASEVSKRAAAVKCSSAEYRDGLVTIIETLQTDLDANLELNDKAIEETVEGSPS